MAATPGQRTVSTVMRVLGSHDRRHTELATSTWLDRQTLQTHPFMQAGSSGQQYGEIVRRSN